MEAQATWLRGFANELNRIVGVLDAEAGSGLFVSHLPEALNRPHGATFATLVRGGYGVGSAASSGATKGGRPKPPTDLGACEAAVGEIITEIEDSLVASGGADESSVGAIRGEGGEEDNNIMGHVRRAVELASRTKEAIRSTRGVAFHGDVDLAADVRSLGERLDIK